MVAMGASTSDLAISTIAHVGCHTNAQLRQTHFVGDVERVVNFFTFVATENEWLAKLGVRN